MINLAQGNEKKNQGSKENVEGKEKNGFGKRMVLILLLALLLFFGGAYVAIRMGAVARLGWLFQDSLTEEPKFMYPVPEIIVNLEGNTRRQQFLTVKFYLGFDEPKLEKEIEKRMPELRDAVLGILWNKDIEDINAPGGKDLLKKEMFQVINELLNSGEIRELYFWHVMVQ